MSAAKAIADHMRDWTQGSGGKIVSMVREARPNPKASGPSLRAPPPVPCLLSSQQGLRLTSQSPAHLPTRQGIFQGDGLYSVPSTICFSMPCTCANGEWKVVEGLGADSFSAAKMKATLDELTEEKKMADELLAPAVQ